MYGVWVIFLLFHNLTNILYTNIHYSTFICSMISSHFPPFRIQITSTKEILSSLQTIGFNSHPHPSLLSSHLPIDVASIDNLVAPHPLSLQLLHPQWFLHVSPLQPTTIIPWWNFNIYGHKCFVYVGYVLQVYLGTSLLMIRSL